MKKFVSIVLLAAILLSCCACGKGQSNGSVERELDPTSPEAMYGHIDQTKLLDGVYKIWNADGVLNIINHPEADFEVLCDIDMGGAVLTPIGTAEAPFKGLINGGSFTISNFTVQGGDEESFGFFGVSKGVINALNLADVTFLPGANAKNIGTLVGSNSGRIGRSSVGGTLEVTQAAANANIGSLVGTNTGSLSVVKAYVDLKVTAPGAANVGGITGSQQGGKVDFAETHGRLEIEGQNKTVGLYAGVAKDVAFESCVFIGEINSINGKLFNNFVGAEENVTAADCLWRDNEKEPLPDNVRALRTKVVEAMNAMGSIKWNLKEDLIHSCTCQLSSCHGSYSTQYTYYGLPYNHKSSPLERFEYCLTEDGYIPDWFYELESFDGFDRYFGTDCSAALQQAWWTVSNSVTIFNTNNIAPYYGMGTIAVGDYIWNVPMENNWTEVYITSVDEQVIYEAYGKMRAGDGYVCRSDVGGHTRMAAQDAVVVRDQEGKINPKYSYVISSEQGSTTRDDTTMTITTWKLNYKYTFANLYYDWYIPVTCEELLTGEMEPVEVKLEGGCEGYAGMFTGTVKANYRMNSLTLKITDSKGNVVLDRPMWTSVDKTSDYGSNAITNRMLIMEQDMGRFTTWLQEIAFEKGESYNYTVTASLATGDKVLVLESGFVYGQAQ